MTDSIITYFLYDEEKGTLELQGTPAGTWWIIPMLKAEADMALKTLKDEGSFVYKDSRYLLSNSISDIFALPDHA